MLKKETVSIFWFRRDLRINDNNGLFQSLNNSEKVLPIFIFDKNILNKLSNKNDKRVAFIHKTLELLNNKLISYGSSLLVLYDEPINAFIKICEKYNVKKVFTNNDYEPYAINRDTKINNWLKTKNIQFNSFKDQVIFEKNEILKADKTPYTIFTPYSKIWKQKINENKIATFPSEKFVGNLLKLSPLTIPSINEIGFENTETNSLLITINKEIISNYNQTRNFPAVNGTSKLSVHFRFGTVSIRELTLIALKLNEQWLNELIWREFFMTILYHFPYVITNSFKKKYDNIIWRNNEKEFEQWCNGKTGYPLIDAGMSELNQTGLMHNRVRMVVASFLTKHLFIDWRWGEAYFAEKLLDFELSSNNGNWQWSAGCGCDATPYFRIFNPEEQIKKFDPEFVYINKWIKNYNPLNTKQIVEHKFARERALQLFKKYLN